MRDAAEGGMGMQDILTKMNHKKKQRMSPKHPFYMQKKVFRQMYGAGIFIHAGLNRTVNTLNNFELERLLTVGLGLDSKDMAEVIRCARNEKMVLEFLIRELKEPVSRYLYILDMLSVSMRSTPLSDEEVEAIEAYADMFQIKHEKLELLVQFSSYAYQGDTAHCEALYRKMQNLDMGLSIQDIRYYITELSCATVVGQRELELEKQLVIVDNCEIHEDIVLYEGMMLTFDHTAVRIYGNISMMGGELRILHSRIIKKNENHLSCIHVKRDAILYIQNSSFECRNHGMAVKQEDGMLTVLSSHFSETAKGAAIRFWGRQFTIADCVFMDCYSPKDGGAIFISGGRGSITGTNFVNCEARRGGAICCHDETEIKNCSFEDCKVEEYGAAVYGTMMIQDRISGLKFKDCLPKEAAVVQYLSSKGKIRVSGKMEIYISSIIDCSIEVEDMGTLAVENAVLYVNMPIVCRGRLQMHKVHVEAGYIKDNDMLVLARAKECILDFVEIDGGCKCGGIHAAGTRLKASRCVFRNTVSGRAIYDAYMPVITACVFNFCQDGAILSQGGTITNCMFINCRSSSGAGIILRGRGGVVSGCTFRRCVAEYAAGAIKKMGNHRIERCTYENCKPNDVL